MIHYHGTAINPNMAAAAILAGRHALVSFRHPQQIELVAKVTSSFVLDNGAFSAWRSGVPVDDWVPYYEWVGEWLQHPGFDWALIPDVIDGDENANDALLDKWPHDRAFGVPVWHMHESLDRLANLAAVWPRVALGSSGNYAKVGATNWWTRMRRAMDTVCPDARPACKLHGLRMLNPRIFRHLPLASADSCNIGRNIGLDSAWVGTYTPHSKAWRGQVMAARIEAEQSAARWDGADQMEQALLGGGAA